MFDVRGDGPPDAPLGLGLAVLAPSAPLAGAGELSIGNLTISKKLPRKPPSARCGAFGAVGKAAVVARAVADKSGSDLSRFCCTCSVSSEGMVKSAGASASKRL